VISVDKYQNFTIGNSIYKTYEGQQTILANISKFSNMNIKTAVYMNTNDVPTSLGYGRIITKDYMFDGLIDIDAN
jgi:hypothetical protein